MNTLKDILNQRNLSAFFQPVMNLSSGSFLGFEGLIRGPAASPLHLPARLFAAARQHGLSLEVEMLCRQIVLDSFAAQNLPGKLFLNVSPETLTHPSFKNGQTLSYLEKLGLDPQRIIIEITENQSTFNFEAMCKALLHYRSMDFQIAMDDLGEGFSSLRLWSELRPEYVKIDRHFVQGVGSDPLKQQFLRSIQQIAQSSGAQVIAEGIATGDELRVIRDIGIACGQGYFIAQPSPTPPLTVPVEVAASLSGQARRLPNGLIASRNNTTDKLLRHIEPAHPDTEHEKIFFLFSENQKLRSIPVVENGMPVGLIERQNFITCFTQPSQRELLGKKPCSTCLDGKHCKNAANSCMNNAPLLVDKSTPIHELSDFLTESDSLNMSDGFIITQGGRYAGVGSAQDLLREITRMQIENARYANPLTLLPGNVPVNEHIEHLLNNNEPFAVCYADLDNFKPFNDVYGYSKGDEAIQFTGRLLANICNPQYDYIGHIGGDDFILILQSTDWEQRCHRAIAAFARTSTILFDSKHRAMGGYLTGDRQGQIVHHPLPTLSLGVVWVNPENFNSHHEVAEAATAAKKTAQKKPGNSLFIERRRLPQPEVIETDISLVYYG